MNKQKSFTLIELLVVIVIIGILAGVIMISTSSSINKANITKVKVFEESVANNLAANMVSRWKLDEGSGTVANDSWGSNNGTLVNGPTWKSESDCVSGGCLSFDGTDDYVNCVDINVIDNTSFTISFWGKLSWPGGGHRVIIGKKQGLWEDAIKGFEVIQTSTNNIKIYISDGVNIYNKSLPADQGKWEHYVFILSREEIKIRAYINGSLSGTDVLITTGFNSVANNDALRLMSRATAGGYYNRGYLDDIRIYSEAISSSRIKQNYIAGLDSLFSKGNISKEEYNQRLNELAIK